MNQSNYCLNVSFLDLLKILNPKNTPRVRLTIPSSVTINESKTKSPKEIPHIPAHRTRQKRDSARTIRRFFVSFNQLRMNLEIADKDLRKFLSPMGTGSVTFYSWIHSVPRWTVNNFLSVELVTSISIILRKIFMNVMVLSIVDFQALLGKIIDVDENILFATICDMDGKVVHTSHRKGETSMLTDDENNESLHYAANAWKIRNKLSHKIGKGKYAFAVYEKIRRITMPLGNEHLLYVTIDNKGGQSDIIEFIRNILEGDPTRPYHRGPQTDYFA